MDQRTRANIALFWRMLPKEVRRNLFVKEDLCEVNVYLLVPEDSLLRDVDHAHELTLAEARYCTGFDFFPISARHIGRGSTEVLLRGALRFVPVQSER